MLSFFMGAKSADGLREILGSISWAFIDTKRTIVLDETARQLADLLNPFD